MFTIKLNAVSSRLFRSKGNKVRLETANGVLRAKPTDRAVSADLVTQHVDADGTVSFVVPDKYMEEANTTVSASRRGTLAMRQEKYGWIALVPMNEDGMAARVV